MQKASMSCITVSRIIGHKEMGWIGVFFYRPLLVVRCDLRNNRTSKEDVGPLSGHERSQKMTWSFSGSRPSTTLSCILRLSFFSSPRICRFSISFYLICRLSFHSNRPALSLLHFSEQPSLLSIPKTALRELHLKILTSVIPLSFPFLDPSLRPVSTQHKQLFSIVHTREKTKQNLYQK